MRIPPAPPPMVPGGSTAGDPGVAAAGQGDGEVSSGAQASQHAGLLSGARSSTTDQATSAVLSAVFEHAGIGIALVDSAGVPFDVNPACCRILGRPAEQLTKMSFAQVTHPEDLEADWDLYQQLLGGERESYQIDKRYLRPDGGVVWGRLTVSAVRRGGGGLAFAVGMIEDVTERRRLVEELRQQALRDPLTGLPNRVLLHDRLKAALARAARTEEVVALLFVDLDGFKQLNDAHGHAAGDAALIAVARRLAASLRTTDTVARFGGDEFVVLCEGLDSESDGRAVAARLRATVSAPIVLMHGPQTLGASVGVAFAQPGEAADGRDLLQRADAAMYLAKRTRAR